VGRWGCPFFRSGWPRGLRGLCADDGAEAAGGDGPHGGREGAEDRLPGGMATATVGTM